MINIPSFEEFLNESYLEKVQFGMREKLPVITYRYKGNPSMQMPLIDVLEALREHYKMSKRDFPTNKKSVSSIDRGQTEVITPDGFTIQWHPSGPNTTHMIIKGPGKEERDMKKMDDLLVSITSEYNPNISNKVELWERLPGDVRDLLEIGFNPPLSAKNIVGGGDESLTIDYDKSTFMSNSLPRDYKYIGDDRKINYSVKTPKRMIQFNPTGKNSRIDITW